MDEFNPRMSAQRNGPRKRREHRADERASMCGLSRVDPNRALRVQRVRSVLHRLDWDRLSDLGIGTVSGANEDAAIAHRKDRVRLPCDRRDRLPDEPLEIGTGVERR
jgi:hypothetical protein